MTAAKPVSGSALDGYWGSLHHIPVSWRRQLCESSGMAGVGRHAGGDAPVMAL
jgi:hypothetical protein